MVFSRALETTSFFLTGSTHKAQIFSMWLNLKTQKYNIVLSRVLFPRVSLFPQGSEGKSLHLGFVLFPELLLLLPATCCPKTWHLHHCFQIQTQSIVMMYLNTSKPGMDFILIISQQGSAWLFINREKLEEDGIISTRSEHKPI